MVVAYFFRKNNIIFEGWQKRTGSKLDIYIWIDVIESWTQRSGKAFSFLYIRQLFSRGCSQQTQTQTQKTWFNEFGL